MPDYKLTPAEKRQTHLDVLKEIAATIETIYKLYLHKPTKDLEDKMRSLKATYDIYKQNNL